MGLILFLRSRRVLVIPMAKLSVAVPHLSVAALFVGRRCRGHSLTFKVSAPAWMFWAGPKTTCSVASQCLASR